MGNKVKLPRIEGGNNDVIASLGADIVSVGSGSEAVRVVIGERPEADDPHRPTVIQVQAA